MSAAVGPIRQSLLFVLVTIFISVCNGEKCDHTALSRCDCGIVTFDRKPRYIVNCTDTNFNDTKPLEHLPPETEVLLFTGNRIKQLPWNVFGTMASYPALTVVDMSNNHIEEVLGKSYHRVSNVRRLILNHNHISIAQNQHHPRIFSNFINLEELHLTNAFIDNEANLGSDLYDIFLNSELKNLIKLHLEQNEITSFKNKDVFCALPQILDLHLGNNHLSRIDFRIDCLLKLRYIDLEGNNLTRLTNTEMKNLDALPARKQQLEINLTDNPFSCECGIHQLFDWVQNTSVNIAQSNRLRCHRHDGELPPKHPENVTCDEPPKLLSISATSYSPAVLTILILLALSITVLLIYKKRKIISLTLQPMVETVSKKVYYSSIGHNDDQEINV